MAAAFRSLCFCIFLNVFLTSLASAQEESQFIYNGFSEPISRLFLDGVAKIHPSGVLQLTNTDYNQTGHAFYPFQFRLNTSSSNSFSFSTNFVFAMVPAPSRSPGHGIVFIISPSMDFRKAVSAQHLGLPNVDNNGNSTYPFLGVELDTFQNQVFNDINDNHVGIDVNDVVSVESAPAAYFSDKEGKNTTLKLDSGNPIQVWIDYNGTENLLNVSLAPLEISKPNRPLLSAKINLSQILFDVMFVGFSASNGQLVSDKYILGWSFNRNGQAQNLNISNLPPIPPPLAEANKTRTIIILVVVFVAAVVIVLITIGGAIYLVRKKRYEEVCEDWEREYGPQRFSYKDLYKATKGFKDRELIGKGGFGKVYRGVLPSSNAQIAVKRVSHDSKQGMKEFVAEIASMGKLRHRNLVQLRGYCRRRGELLLVYDYMPNGSLDKYLYSDTKLNLNWFQRFHIIRGIASGLLYLHEEWEQVVLHRDIKPGNVLLDADLNGKLGDFGLAKLYDHGSNPQTTNLVGTFGYLAPELIMRTGKATISTDVYAFGVFMLEVACGRRPIEQQASPETANLVYWVTDCWKRGSILDASDPRLEGTYEKDQMELVLKIGLYCSHSNPAARPNMRQVMQYLDGDVMLPNTLSDSTGINFLTANVEDSESEMSFPSFLGNGSVVTSDSILTVGR